MKVMKQSVFVFVFVILSAVFVSRWGGDRDKEALPKYKPLPDFNYFLLALTWPNQFCLSNPCKPSDPPQSFTIHGLWPQFTPTRAPHDCYTTQEPSNKLFNELRDDLLKYWPDLKNAEAKYFEASKRFWKHEWREHGTCSTNKVPVEDYFKKSINLAKEYSAKILKGLEKRGVIPDGKNHSGLDILNAVKESIGVVPSLGLTDQGRALLEIRLCVADDAETLLNCGDLTFAADPSLSPSPSPSPSPSTSEYQYPPSRSTRWWVSSALEAILKNAV